MRLTPNLAREFEELSAEYNSHDEQGRDIITLVKMFGEECDELKLLTDFDYKVAWRDFLEEHKHQVDVPMTGMILYLLVTYWEKGRVLYDALPPLETILLRDTVQEIYDEIDRKSAANGDAVLVVPE